MKITEKINKYLSESKNKSGKIQGKYLIIDGKKYKIRYKDKDNIILDTDKLYGEFGDEFPLKYIK